MMIRRTVPHYYSRVRIGSTHSDVSGISSRSLGAVSLLCICSWVWVVGGLLHASRIHQEGASFDIERMRVERLLLSPNNMRESITAISDSTISTSSRILSSDGRLTPETTYSTLANALIDTYLNGKKSKYSQKAMMRQALRIMKANEEDGKLPLSSGVFNNVSFSQLSQAIIAEYHFGSEVDPWHQLKVALDLMDKIESHSIPIQIANHPFLYVGTAGATFNFDALKAAGITHILSVTTGINGRYPDDFQYMHIGKIHDNNYDKNKLRPHFDNASAFIEDARKQGGAVMVHCWAGQSRSVTILTAYLIQMHGYTRDTALALIRRTRPTAAPIALFMGELEELERSLRIRQADSNEPLPKNISVLGADGHLLPDVQYSTIRRAAVRQYLNTDELKRNPDEAKAWDQFKTALQEMKGGESNKDKRVGCPLAGISYTQLEQAVLREYFASASDVTDSWEQMMSALWAMRRKEIDGEPVPIEVHTGPNTPLFIGGAGAAFNRKALQEQGITAIISVSPSIGKIYPQEFEYMHIRNVHNNEAGSSEENSLYPYFHSTFEFIERARKNGGKVFVHCQQGKSRSATIMAAYLMKSENITRNDALDIVKRSRTKAAPNRQYMHELKKYEKMLNIRAR